MLVYHGTTADRAEKIKREGLKPKGSKPFDLSRADNYFGMVYPMRDDWEDKNPAVFLTTKKEIAREFAILRAKYERAQEGAMLPWGHTHMIKLSAEREPDAKPALLTIDLPSNWELENDPNSTSPGTVALDAKISHKPIPPQFIEAVTVLSLNAK